MIIFIIIIIVIIIIIIIIIIVTIIVTIIICYRNINCYFKLVIEASVLHNRFVSGNAH